MPKTGLIMPIMMPIAVQFVAACWMSIFVSCELDLAGHIRIQGRIPLMGDRKYPAF